MVLPLPKGEGWGEGEGRFLLNSHGLALHAAVEGTETEF